ncbi:tRNA lysidine(34) synthetase TilS [Oricola thermophila]|uniref:tRNA(Ile)-lysidine synthase n=1 Tax=Oricola thermophila TaxID=2742145 RepID=A0A6N1VHL2_9HYPH|nr:tRNA lysidine(34) synthetase TilS [Oricola thermophila]QKV20456.1 tRNA lysidine(34) synthetase TilS [Oricola thermophila]
MLTDSRAAEQARRNLFSIALPTDGRIVIALSGGSDSTALLVLAREVFSARGARDRMLAITVDHGLRSEAADEARRCGELCASLGIAHAVRRWEGEKPAKAVQAAAREARYGLLAEAAGDGIVLTGHTMDDQLETVAMRQARGAGRGLSGIAPATLYEKRTWFVRPLLTCRRADLRAQLSKEGMSWIEDPSNRDTRFERVRIRMAMRENDTLSDAAIRENFNLRRAESEQAAALLRDERRWRFDADSRAAEHVPGDDGAGPGTGLALAVVASWVGQCPNLPARDIIGRMIAFCEGAGKGERLTVSGCLLERRADHVRFRRESRNRRETGYGYDHLLPSPDFAVAQALCERAVGMSYPVPPVSGYPD